MTKKINRNANTHPKVLIIDDDESISQYLTNLLSLRGYHPIAVNHGEKALELISKGDAFLFVLLDVMIPGLNGLEVLKQIKQINSNLPVIMISVLGQTNTVVSAIKRGASNYLVKPFEPEELELVIQNTLEKQSLLQEANLLRKTLSRRKDKTPFLFFNEKMVKIWELIKNVSPMEVTVLILGESGVGKELISHEIHKRSPRRAKPFIKINCATLPENLLESELFGYEKGAFTGAFRKKLGKFDFAHEGTIFLDEIGDIHPSLQAKLLHVLQDGDFSRLGGKDEIRVNVRVLAATNKDLAKAVKKRQFREDLYYRLNVVRITIPPLRERKDEIPMFIDHFLKLWSARYGKEPFKPSGALMGLFASYHWPGNVRELENMIQRLVVLEDEASIIQDLYRLTSEDLTLSADDEGENFQHDNVISLKQASRMAAEEAERKAILQALAETNWHRKKAADLLNISYKSLIYRIDRLGLKG